MMKSTHRWVKSKDSKQRTQQEKRECTNDILNDLESGFPLLLDSAAMSFHCREESFSKSQMLPTEKDASTESAGLVVSEFTMEEGNAIVLALEEIKGS